jgi:hypothetical protein
MTVLTIALTILGRRGWAAASSGPLGFHNWATWVLDRTGFSIESADVADRFRYANTISVEIRGRT